MVEVSIRRRLRRTPGPTADAAGTEPRRPTACHAASTALYLFPDGDVRVCCISTLTLGNIRRRRLPELWEGAVRRRLVDALAEHDYSQGCESCGAEVALEGHAASYPANFDRFADPAGAGPWPRTMGLYLSNVCNLQCVQCHGENSSAIRKHREGRPPLRSSYGDEFFDDLRPFLPHLELAYFAGGEPFLIPEMYRAWALIAEVAPDLECQIVTNGTQWNERVERALDTIRASIVVSIDAATPSTFGATRVGADLDTVLANLDRFAAYTARRGTTISINFCLMTNNHHEFGALLHLAAERGIHVDVSVVREPAQYSIANLPPDEIAAIHRSLVAEGDRLGSRLGRNLPTWQAEVDRIGAWAAASARDLEAVGGRSNFTVLGFRHAGVGPTDDGAASELLGALVPGATVHRIDIATDDTVAAVGDSARAVLGAAAVDLVGSHVASLWPALTARFGRSSGFEEVDRDDDTARVVARFAGTTVTLVLLAVRDRTGEARSGRIVFVVDEGPDPSGARRVT